MYLNNVIKINQTVLSAITKNVKVAIDATAGNGHDSEFIVKNFPGLEILHCCDIQRLAIEKTKQRLEPKVSGVSIFYHQKSHHLLFQEINTDWDLVMFNLGYLPGTSHDIMTNSSTTICALNEAKRRLSRLGIISVITYPGTATGAQEHGMVYEWAKLLPQSQWDVCLTEMINQVNNPPCLFLFEKK